MRYYKVLDDMGRSCNGGTYHWSLPVKNADGSWTPGEWTIPVQGELIPCNNGYHVCRAHDLGLWLGQAIYEVEVDLLDSIREDDCYETKVVVRRARLLRKIETWNADTALKFCLWMVEEAMRLYRPDFADRLKPVAENSMERVKAYCAGDMSAADIALVQDLRSRSYWEGGVFTILLQILVSSDLRVSSRAIYREAKLDHSATRKLMELLGEKP